MSYGNEFLDGLEPDDLLALSPHLRRMEVTAGQIMIEQDGPIPEVHFPVDAQLVNQVRFSDGRALETALVGSEGVSGLAPFMADEPCGWEVAVRMAGTLYAVPARVLRQRQGVSPALINHLLRLSHLYQMQAVQHAACSASHRLLPRVARWLLKAADLNPDQDIRFTQEHLASSLGSQRTSINDAASQLKDRSLIRYARGVIRILDRPGLERVACECYAMERARIEKAGVMP